MGCPQDAFDTWARNCDGRLIRPQYLGINLIQCLKLENEVLFLFLHLSYLGSLRFPHKYMGMRFAFWLTPTRIIQRLRCRQKAIRGLRDLGRN